MLTQAMQRYLLKKLGFGPHDGWRRQHQSSCPVSWPPWAIPPLARVSLGRERQVAIVSANWCCLHNLAGVASSLNCKWGNWGSKAQNDSLIITQVVKMEPGFFKGLVLRICCRNWLSLALYDRKIILYYMNVFYGNPTGLDQREDVWYYFRMDKIIYV